MINEKYPETLELINQQKKGSNIDWIALDFLKKQIKEIKEGKRKDTDIGDAFGIFIQNKNIGKKSFSEKVKELLFNLGDYQVEINNHFVTDLNSIKDVEKELNKIEITN